jgi:hypothetical protein
MRLGFNTLGVRVKVFVVGVKGLGIRVWFRAYVLGFRILDLGLSVNGLGFRV